MELMTTNDLIGFIGVFILLIAFLLNLLGKLAQQSYGYLLLNFVGAGLACLASVLINYLPFVILEGVWALVSLVGLVRKMKR
jgi:hypothetical protein